MRRPAFKDSQIFFAAVLGMATVLVVQVLVFRLVGADIVAPTHETTAADVGVPRAGAASDHVPLIRQIGPPGTVSLLYGFFVLLPAGLAFLCIGVPFALRTLIAAIQRKLSRTELLGLAAFIAALCLLAAEPHLWTHGLTAIVAVAAVAIWQAWEPIATRARRLAFRMLGLGGIALGVLANYENRLLQHGEASIALAPTALVAAAFFIGSGLVLSALALARFRLRAATAACWLIAAAWYLAPTWVPLVADPASGGRLELVTTVAASAVLVSVTIVREIREIRDAGA
jgi:hypothetical protein